MCSQAFPQISLDRINIDMSYLGAVHDKVEEATQGLGGTEQTTSTAVAEISPRGSPGAGRFGVFSDVRDLVIR